jgi:hypothetical protein
MRWDEQTLAEISSRAGVTIRSERVNMEGTPVEKADDAGGALKMLDQEIEQHVQKRKETQPGWLKQYNEQSTPRK